jgi:hypothetical protein
LQLYHLIFYQQCCVVVLLTNQKPTDNRLLH